MKWPYKSFVTLMINATIIHKTFSSEIAHYGESSFSVFQEIFAGTDKNFISQGGLRIRQ